MEVHHLFLGQDSLVQAPVLKKPAYSPLSHSPSLNFTMENGMSCRLPGCNYSTTSQIPAEVEHYLHWQLLDYHFKTGHVPKDEIVKSELAIKPDDVSTSVASSDDEQILATQLEGSKCD